MRRYPNHRRWYGGAYWGRYPGLRWRYRPGFNCWRWAAWASVIRWLPWGWSQPVYYNYGDNVYYQEGNVYYGEDEYATEAEYAEQAETIANGVPAEVDQDSIEWMSLGVFAITQDGEASGAEPTMFLQLTVSKDGIIGGTYQNAATETVVSIEGMVDKKSQRAAFTVVGQERPIIETGIYNLTEDTAPALIHFADKNTQQVLLVRLDEQEEAPK